MSISFPKAALNHIANSVPDTILALITELIRHPPCSIDQDVRAVFAKAGKARCVFCRAAPVEEVDHLIPVALGGPDRLENYVGTCRSCNTRKTAHLLPLGILGILLAEAESHAPKRRALIERRRSMRERANPRRRKEIKPATKRLPHHILLSLEEDDLLDLIGLDALFRGEIPLDIVPDRLLPAVRQMLAGEIADGPYMDRLRVDVSGGRMVYSVEVASLWIALLSLRGDLPQVMTGPDWPAQRIEPRANQNRRGKFYQAHVSFGIEDAARLLQMLRNAENRGELDCDGEDAAFLYGLATSGTGLHGTISAPGWGGSNLFPEGRASLSHARFHFAPHAARILEILIRERSACVILRETGGMMRDFRIDRAVPVRPGLLNRADQDWGIPL